MKLLREILKEINKIQAESLTKEDLKLAEFYFGDLEEIKDSFVDHFSFCLNTDFIKKDLELIKLSKIYNIELPKKWQGIPVMAIASSFNHYYDYALKDLFLGSVEKLIEKRTRVFTKLGFDVNYYKEVKITNKKEKIMLNLKEILKEANKVESKELTTKELKLAQKIYGDLSRFSELYVNFNENALRKDLELLKLAVENNVELPKFWQVIPVMALATSLNADYNLAMCDMNNGSAKELDEYRTKIFNFLNLDTTNLKEITLKEENIKVM